jgi:hypothetical protein
MNVWIYCNTIVLLGINLGIPDIVRKLDRFGIFVNIVVWIKDWGWWIILQCLFFLEFFLLVYIVIWLLRIIVCSCVYWRVRRRFMRWWVVWVWFFISCVWLLRCLTIWGWGQVRVWFVLVWIWIWSRSYKFVWGWWVDSR